MRIDESLRYLATQDVDNVAGDASVTVRSADGDELGRLDGFMVDPDRRTLRYYVVTPLRRVGHEAGPGAICARLS